MSLLVWRQMNAYYALGSDGAHVYSVSCAHVRGVPTFHAWRRPSGDKPGESIGGAFSDEATAKRACQRDLDQRTKAQASMRMQTACNQSTRPS